MADRAEMVSQLEKLNHQFAAYIALNKAMGIVFTHLGDGVAEMKLPWDPRFIGDPDGQILHGGAITVLVDSCCGAAAFMGLDAPQGIATLDLRIDYLKPATPGRDLLARCECYKMTRSVAFIRGFAFHDDPDDPIAASQATFMVGTHVPGLGA